MTDTQCLLSSWVPRSHGPPGGRAELTPTRPPRRRCDPGTRAFLLMVLIATGCNRDQTTSLLADLKSADIAARRKAAESLAETASADERVVPALAAALSDPDLEVRRWSCRGLGYHRAASAQSALEERLRDSETSVRRAAAFALHQVAPDSTAYRPELIAAMKSGDGGVIVAIAKWQPPPTWAAETLVGLLKDRRPGIRRLAAEALGELGISSADTTAALQRVAHDPDDRVREAVAAALARLQK